MSKSSPLTTQSIWQRGERDGDLSCDVAVVGGGIVGASTAYWLKRGAPDMDVVLLEADEPASGASGRNAGFLLQGTSADYMSDIQTHGSDRARRLWHFSQENRDLIAGELSPRAFEFEASGSLTVAGTAEEDERLRRCVSRMRADGFPAAYISAAETNRRLVGRGFHGSLYVASGAMLNPVRLVNHIVEKSGARLLSHHPVLAIADGAEGVDLETTKRRVRARQVVLALNAYLPLLLPALSPYVQPIRAQMLATEPASSRWLQLPAYSHEGFYYVRQRADGVVLVGGARHLHMLEERGYADQTTPALQADLEKFLHQHFPQTRGLAVARRWSGVMGFSPDGLPVVGEVPHLAGSYFATGFTGHGMGYGFRFGRLLAEMIRRGRSATDADLFLADRFSDLPRSSLRAVSR